MTPQSSFMVLAPITRGREQELRDLLASMNQPQRPGMADAENALVPFGQFERLHFARFVVLEAPTAEDVTVYGLPPARWQTSLVFLGDFDGPANTFLADLVARAGAGLREVFAFCQDFSSDSDLLEWMKRHEQPSAASYVNWIGRTVVQIHEEQALHRALVDHLQNGAATASDGESPLALHDRLVSFVDAEQQAGRLPLTPEAPTPLGWRLRNAIDKIGVPIALLVLAPFLLIASPLLVYQLRSREKGDLILLLPPLRRLRLPIRKDPYWAQLKQGVHCGYYRPSNMWWRRARVDGRYVIESFAAADDYVDADGQHVLNWEQAQAAVRAWAAKQTGVGPLTVDDVVDSYLDDLRARKGKRPSARAEGSLRKHFRNHPTFAERRVADLTVADVTAFRNSMVPKDGADEERIRRARDTANRIMSMVSLSH
jgi:hypothetical protein